MNIAQHLDELLNDCRRLAPIVAPEISGAPLYIERQPRNYPETGACIAFTTIGIDITIREMLLSQGRWRGPGATIILTAAGLVDWETAAGLLLHELGHTLPVRVPPVDIEPTSAERIQQRARIVEMTSSNQAPQMPNWWPAHGRDFVRTCIHLHWRAWAAGFEVPLPNVCVAGNGYDLAPAWEYLHALDDEPQRLADCTFAEILATPPPAEFSDLYLADVLAWQRSRGTSPKLEQISA